MRKLIMYLSALSALSPTLVLSSSGQLHDLLAFPKYSIDFLNDLPLSATDAERCVEEGVAREDEFVAPSFSSDSRRSIGDDDVYRQSKLELIPMKIAEPDTTDIHDYLCLVPRVNTTSQRDSATEEEQHAHIDPAQSWQALSHLDGKCLYSVQGWFTYSYCHNSHIRQFRQARHLHPHPPDGFIPEEDLRFEAYTLGKAATDPSLSPKRKSTVPAPAPANPVTAIDRLGHEHALSFGLQPSARYLTQRWSDGSRCDKNGRPREVEVQVHCGMTSTDRIYLIKEVAVCQYVMIIHSPHLCALPGFATETPGDDDTAVIRCREVISDEDFAKWSSGEANPNAESPLAIDRSIPVLVPEGAGSGRAQEAATESEARSSVGAELTDLLMDVLGDESDVWTGKEIIMINLEDELEAGDGNDDLAEAFNDATVLGGESGLGPEERELLLKMVTKYLQQKKDKDTEEDERKRDEL